MIAKLLQNKLDISMLVISKSLGKGSDASDYKNHNAAHVSLAMKLKKRDPGSAPQVGDRVPYIITKGLKKQAAYERSEDPVYVLEHSIPIDTEYYLTNQLSKPLTRIFEPIIKDTSSLFSGEHTRVVSHLTPTSGGGLLQFAVKKKRCLNCRTPIPSSNQDQVPHFTHLSPFLYHHLECV